MRKELSPKMAVVVFVFSVAVFVGLLLTRDNEVYEMSVGPVLMNSDLKQALGEPLRAGWMMSGHMKTNGVTGRARLEYPVFGPRGLGWVKVQAERTRGQWNLIRVEASAKGLDKPVLVAPLPINRTKSGG